MSQNNKALLIGINYIGTRSALNGCINDVKNVRSYLIEQFSVVHEIRLDDTQHSKGSETSHHVSEIVAALEHHAHTNNVVATTHQEQKQQVSKVTDEKKLTLLILTDDQSGRHLPTRRNIIDAFEWLVKDTQPGDKRFLHYSGHGSQTRDYNGDEADVKDECLCPFDYATAGMIVDDDVRRLLIDTLPNGAQLHIIIDACHSQSATDCAYNYKCDSIGLFRHKSNFNPIIDTHHKETACQVVCWSGCFDSSTSADTYINGSYAGALTSTFMEIMRDPAQKKSYADLYVKLLDLLSSRKYSQVAQLSSGKPLDLSETFNFF